MPALTTGTSIMGSALSFLLVFRLSWSFGRWWEARGLLGTAMTKTRNLASMITANSGEPSEEQAQGLLELRLVCKMHIATMVDILVQDAAETDDQKKLRSSKSVRALIRELDPREVKALGEERARLLARSTRRILVVHSWLAHAIRNCAELQLLRAFEQDSALDCQNDLLSCYYSSMKIKTTPMPGGICAISLVVRFAFCVVLFPQYMAYAFVMKLDREQHEAGVVWSKGGTIFRAWFIALTGIMIAFFSVIHIVALELDDPYGVDGSDLPMEKMRVEVWRDLDAIAQMYVDNNKLGGGRGLKSFTSSSKIHQKLKKLAAKHKTTSDYEAAVDGKEARGALPDQPTMFGGVVDSAVDVISDTVDVMSEMTPMMRENSYAPTVITDDVELEEEEALEEALEYAREEDVAEEDDAAEEAPPGDDRQDDARVDATKAAAAVDLVDQVVLGTQKVDDDDDDFVDHGDDHAPADGAPLDVMITAELKLAEAKARLDAAKAKKKAAASDV